MSNLVIPAEGPSPSHDIPSPDALRHWNPEQNCFAVYLVKYLTAVEHYRVGTVPEAAALQAGCDLVLSRSEGLSLQIICIVDRETNPLSRFESPAAEVDSIGAACLKYCGSIGRTQMPVGIQIIEIGRHPATPDEKARLAVYRPFSMQSKVRTYAWLLDPASGSVWANTCTGRLYGRKLARLMREPRRSDAELQAAGAPAAVNS